MYRQACERAAVRFGLVPEAIAAGGYSAAANYENTLRTGKRRPCHVRVYLLGHERVGKTSLYRNLTKQKFRHNEPRTTGAVLCDVKAHEANDDWKELSESQSNFDRVVVRRVAELLASAPVFAREFAALLVVLLGLLTVGAAVCCLMPTQPFVVTTILLLAMPFVGWGMALSIGVGLWSVVLCVEILALALGDSSFDMVWIVAGLFVVEMMGCLTGTVLGAKFADGVCLTCCVFGLSPGCLVQAGCFESKGFNYFETVSVYMVGGIGGVALAALVPTGSIKFDIFLLVTLPLITGGCVTMSTYCPAMSNICLMLVGGFLFGNGLRYCLVCGRYLTMCFAKLMGTGEKPWYMKTCVASLLVGIALGVLIVHIARYVMVMSCPTCPVLFEFPGSFQQLVTHIADQIVYSVLTLGHWLRNEPIASLPNANVPVESIVDHMTASEVDDLHTPLLKMIDFAGQRAYYAMHHIFLSAQGIFVLVFDFRRACMDFERHMEKLHFWISSVLAIGKNDSTRIFFVGTHRDDSNLNFSKRQRVVRRMFSKFINFHPYICFNRNERDAQLSLVFQIENSALSDDPAVCSLRKQIIEEIRLKHGRMQQNPIRWLALEDHIIHLRNKDLSSVVPLSQLQDEAEKCDIKDEEFSEALGHLNDSGVVFYSNESSLKDYVIIDPQALIDALVALLSIPAFQNRGLHFSGWHRLEKDGIASYELFKHAWRNLRDPIDILVKFLQYYGIIYELTSGHSERYFAVISCLPCKLPSDAWNEPNNEDAHERERRLIYVRFHDIADPHQAFFYVLLTKARLQAESALLKATHHFKVHWSRTAGVFAFHFRKYRSVVLYKLEYDQGMFTLTIQKLE